MQLTQRELEFIRLVEGARFAVESPAIIDLAISVLFRPVFGSRALRAGDEVVVSCLSTPVVVESLVRHGLVPVFVDVCLPTYQVLLDEVEEAIDPDKCSAIFLPHIWGNSFDLLPMRDLADEYGVWLLSEAFRGAESNSTQVGVIEDIGLFLNDGALVCASQVVYDNIKSMHLYEYWKEHESTARAYSNTDMVEQLELLDEYFSDHEEFEYPGCHPDVTPAWSEYPVTLRKSCRFSRADYLDVLLPTWHRKPVSVWHEFRDQKRQEHKMYGVDAVLTNTVLLNPRFSEEIISVTKKFLEDKCGR